MLTVASAAGDLSQTLVVAAAVVALLLSVALYESAQTVTMAHEGAHALSVVLMGGKLGRMHLHRGGGGETNFNSDLDWFGKLVVTSVGYVGPSIFGLIGVFLMRAGQPLAVLWITIALLGLMLLFVDGGFWKVLLFGVLLAAVIRAGSEPLQIFVAVTWIWWLLIGAVVGAVKLVGIVLHGAKSTDAHGLRKLTWIPATIWILAFLAGTGAALVAGGSALLNLSA